MIYCLNPQCPQPQNSDDVEFCLSCGSPLTPLLRNRYRVLRLIGQGGFGRTYLAMDEDRLQARCVVKQFSPQLQGIKSLEKAIQLFEQEAIRLNELGEHPQIPALLAYFEQDSRLYLVQQFVEGKTLLQELAQQGVFTEQKIREVLIGTLPLLKFIHDRQVIHRDITPANIIRRKSDNKLVLIDFGVSKLISAETASQPGTKIGTEGYAPIEQIRSGKAYPASDLYSLAVTCVYLMTQVRPDELYDPLEGCWLWRDRLKQQGRSLSEGMGHILDKMLKDLVSERYPSADAVMRDLIILSRSGASGGSSSSGKPIAAPSSSGANLSGAIKSSNPPSRPPLVSGSGRRCLQTLSGHTQWVLAVAISPDGKTVVSSGLDATIRVWNLAAGDLLQVLKEHTKPVNCLAISPDSQILASGSDDGAIKTWHLPSGLWLRHLSGHRRDVNSVVIYANGQLLASGSEDRSVRIWNLDTGELLRTFSGLAGMIRSIAVSPDHQWLVSGGLDNQIKLWHLSTGKLARTFTKSHFSAINALVIHPNGKTLLSGSKDKTIKIWDLQKGEVIRTLTGHGDAVNAIALSPNGKTVISGSSDTTIRLWNVETGDPIATLSEHHAAVNALAISQNGRLLASGSSDKTVKVWQLG
ncbi:MAG: protein kinase domain-containing protein [Leptolyngbyaceae cyanobacterium]